jgi:TolA-binding protein
VKRPLPMSLSLALAMTLLASQAHAIEAAERLEGPVPDEVSKFREVSERFHERMSEFEDETIKFIDLREAEEREKLREGYDLVIEKLEGKEKDYRDLVVERFEEFLKRYPDVPYSSHVRFRLADLYFEIASEDWLERSEAYYARVEDLEAADDLEALEELDALEQPMIELATVIALYERIVADNKGMEDDERYDHLDGAYYMLGFCYYEPSARSYDPFKAADIYRELIAEMPESPLADQAHLLLGNFLFEDAQFDSAIGEYTFVMNRGEEGDSYVDAMYQLAWSYYKLSDYDQALALFTTLLDHSRKEQLESGKASDYAKDGMTYMAHSFADISEQDPDLDALGVAEAYFAQDTPREHEWDVYRALAEVLVQYLRTPEAIDIYRKLQDDPRWVNHPENPDFQNQIVTLFLTGLEQDPEKAGAARLELTERYNEGSEWWTANRSNPDALAKARGYIESSLLQVAVEFRVRAQESGEPADFALAAAKYKEYLEKFPISDDYYKQQWFLADSYVRAQMFEEAEAEFESLIASKKYHEFGDGAMYQLMDMRLKVALARLGPTDVRPEQAEVERTYVSEAGTEINVYGLLAEHQRFIDAADEVLNAEFAKPEEDSKTPDYGAEVDKRRHQFLYITAQVLFFYNRYDEARPRFLEIIKNHRKTEEGSYSAGLLVDSYLAEDNLDMVRQLTKDFILDPVGPSNIPDPTFENLLEGTAFKQAKQLADAGDFLSAADAFIAFRKEFSDSEHDAFALYNAAHYYQEVGKAEKANELFEQFVNVYPDHEWSQQLYFRIAANYESTFDLDKAIDYYQRLVKKFPDFIDAPNAHYNAAFLKIGIGDHRGAARGFEDYAKNFPEVSDREDTFFRAGEQWEQVSDRDAIGFYKKYLSSYPEGREQFSADHTLKATYQLGKLYENQNNDRAYQAQLDNVLVAFDKYNVPGAELGPDVRGYAAEAYFREVQTKFDELVKDQLLRDDEKDAILLKETKPPELQEFKTMTDGVVARFNSFEWSTAALYLQGMSLFYYADLGLAVLPPKQIREDSDDYYAFMEILEEQFYPEFYSVEDKGIEHLEKLIDAAKKQKRHSKWVDAAYTALNARRPADYPAVKPELLGGADSSVPATIAPVLIEIEGKKVEQAQEAEAPALPTGEPDAGAPPTGGSDVPAAPEPAPAPEESQ